MISVNLPHVDISGFFTNPPKFSPLYLAGPCAAGLCCELAGSLMHNIAADYFEVANGDDEKLTDVNYYLFGGLSIVGKVISVAGRFLQCIAFSAAIGFALGAVNPVVGWIGFFGFLITTFALQLPHQFLKGESLFHSRAKDVHHVSCGFVKVTNLAINTIGGGIVGFSAGLLPGALVGMLSVLSFQGVVEIGTFAVNKIFQHDSDPVSLLIG